MDVTADDFTRHYASLSDEALLEIDTSELTALAGRCHADEVARRGLDDGSGVADEDVASAAPSATAEEEENFIPIAEYDYMEEADIARGLLEGSEIPTRIESEPGVARLLVPEKLAEQALMMLASPLSDEDLAAQAEAAANPDFEDE